MERKMIGLLGLLMSFLIFSCGSDSSQNQQPQQEEIITLPKYTLVIMDKTKSTRMDSAVVQNMENKLDKLVLSRYVENNDMFQANVLHANTLGIAPIFTNKMKSGLPKDYQKLPTSEQEELMNYRIAEQVQLFNQLIQALEQENTTSTSAETNVWGSLELISRTFEGADPQSDRLVVYISDMIESMKCSGCRDFHKKPVKDKAQAIAFAREDVAKIKSKFKINPAALKGISVQIWPPFDQMSANPVAELRYYWEELFTQLGAKEVVFF